MKWNSHTSMVLSIASGFFILSLVSSEIKLSNYFIFCCSVFVLFFSLADLLEQTNEEFSEGLSKKLNYFVRTFMYIVSIPFSLCFGLILWFGKPSGIDLSKLTDAFTMMAISLLFFSFATKSLTKKVSEKMPNKIIGNPIQKIEGSGSLKDDISHLFKNVFIGLMLLINLSLILYVLFSGLALDIVSGDGKLFGLGESFWGALLGAVITGGIAISVFLLGKINDNRKSRKLVENYKVIIYKVHEESIEDFKVFLAASKNEGDLPVNYREIIVRMVTRGKIFDLVEVNGLIKETEQAIYIIDYMITYNEAVKMIDYYHGKYGNIFFKHHIEDNNKSNVEWLEDYIANMLNNISKI